MYVLRGFPTRNQHLLCVLPCWKCKRRRLVQFTPSGFRRIDRSGFSWNWHHYIWAWNHCWLTYLECFFSLFPALGLPDCQQVVMMPGSANAMAFAAGNTHQDMRLADTTLAQLREKIVAGRSSEQAPTPLCDKRSVPVDRGARSIAIPQILISHVPSLENIGHMFECITVKLPASSGSQEISRVFCGGLLPPTEASNARWSPSFVLPKLRETLLSSTLVQNLPKLCSVQGRRPAHWNCWGWLPQAWLRL